MARKLIKMKAGSSKRQQIKTVAIIVAILSIVAVVALAATWYLLQRSDVPSEGTTSDSSLVDSDDLGADEMHFDELTPDEAADRLKSDTGLSLDEVRNKKITEKTFDSPEEALVVAELLQAADDYSKSFEVLDTIYPSLSAGQRSEAFYEAYIAAADYSGRVDKGTEVYKSWREAVAANGGIGEVDKGVILDKLDSKIAEREYSAR